MILTYYIKINDMANLLYKIFSHSIKGLFK